jgi:hypothetical protein
MLDFTIKTEQHWYLPDHAVGIETADNIAWIELLYKPLDFSLTCSYRGYLRKLPITLHQLCLTNCSNSVLSLRHLEHGRERRDGVELLLGAGAANCCICQSPVATVACLLRGYNEGLRNLTRVPQRFPGIRFPCQDLMDAPVIPSSRPTLDPFFRASSYRKSANRTD